MGVTFSEISEHLGCIGEHFKAQFSVISTLWGTIGVQQYAIGVQLGYSKTQLGYSKTQLGYSKTQLGYNWGTIGVQSKQASSTQLH